MASLTTDDDGYQYFKDNVESSAKSGHRKNEPPKIRRRPANVPLPRKKTGVAPGKNIGVARSSPETVKDDGTNEPVIKKKGSDRPTSYTAINADGNRKIIPYASFPSPSKPKKDDDKKIRGVGKNLADVMEEAEDKKPLQRKGAVSEYVEYDEEEWLDELESIIPVNVDSLTPLTAEQELALENMQLTEAEDDKWLAQTFQPTEDDMDDMEDFKFGELSLLDTLTTEELRVNEIIHRIDNGDLSEEEGHKMLAQIHEDLKRTGKLASSSAYLLERYIEKPCKRRSLKIIGPKKAQLTNHIKIKF